jgi:hypothetical protein
VVERLRGAHGRHGGRAAFAIQGALVLAFVARAAVVLIAVAECCSWYAVITTDYTGNALEESLWALTCALVGVALALLAMKAAGMLGRVAAAGAGAALLYVTFMVTHDVPMYLERHREDILHPRTFFSLSAGVNDLLTRWVVTRDFADWRAEMPWMTLYFTVAVWLSIARAWRR